MEEIEITKFPSLKKDINLYVKNTPESAMWFYRFHSEDDKYLNIKWE